MKYPVYKTSLDFSYALGASPVTELLKSRPTDCLGVIFEPSYKHAGIKSLCAEHKVAYEENPRRIGVLSPKGNCYVAAAFRKRGERIRAEKSHVILDGISDMGNLGTVLRSCAGFGIVDVALIGACADYYNPKAVRASMGAVFHVSVQKFASLAEYKKAFADRKIYAFMAGGEANLTEVVPEGGVCSLAFGNEASGLDAGVYKGSCSCVSINQSGMVDSLSLPTAAGIGLFKFFGGSV